MTYAARGAVLNKSNDRKYHQLPNLEMLTAGR